MLSSGMPWIPQAIHSCVCFLSGKVFAFVSMVESLCPVLASLMYVYVYKATLSVFPSTAFFIGALFMVIATSCFL